MQKETGLELTVSKTDEELKDQPVYYYRLETRTHHPEQHSSQFLVPRG